MIKLKEISFVLVRLISKTTTRRSSRTTSCWRQRRQIWSKPARLLSKVKLGQNWFQHRWLNGRLGTQQLEFESNDHLLREGNVKCWSIFEEKNKNPTSPSRGLALIQLLAFLFAAAATWQINDAAGNNKHHSCLFVSPRADGENEATEGGHHGHLGLSQVRSGNGFFTSL